MVKPQSPWRYFHALALDYDGTLTDSGRPDQALLDSLREQRDSGRKLLLVTGRILAELRHEFFDMEDWFDIIVAENGAVLRRGNISRTLAPPVSQALDKALRQRGVPFRRGQVLLAFDGQYDNIVFEELKRLGLDSQVIRNRAASMLLPAGVTKRSGLTEALHILGVSAHSTIAVGDSENDLALFEECELGVAVANSIESLKAQADMVLEEPSAAGVLQFLRSAVIGDEHRIPTSRWRLEVGLSTERQPVTLPASQINLLITGGATGGKSYAAGLLAEQLIEMQYTLCILDPEGDHVALDLLRDVIVVGGEQPLPSVPQLAHLLQHNRDSLVIDMSQLSPAEQVAYAALALEVFRKQRARNGMPHWIFADEAHMAIVGDADNMFVAGEKGYCMITYKPDAVLKQADMTFDFVLLVASECEPEFSTIDYIGELTGIAPAALRNFLASATHGHAVLLRRSVPPELYPLVVGQRAIRHVRHQHKYASAQLQPWHAFHFRNNRSETGAVAGDFAQFHAELLCCDKSVLQHHARGSDFSRWIRDVMSDTKLAESVHVIEKGLIEADTDQAVQTQRGKLLDVISDRYLGAAPLVKS